MWLFEKIPLYIAMWHDSLYLYDIFGIETRKFCAQLYPGNRTHIDLSAGLESNTYHWSPVVFNRLDHYTDVIMTTMASQIISLTVVYSTLYSDADQRNHQSSASLAFVRGIHRDQLRGKCFHFMTSSWCDMCLSKIKTIWSSIFFICFSNSS